MFNCKDILPQRCFTAEFPENAKKEKKDKRFFNTKATKDTKKRVFYC